MPLSVVVVGGGAAGASAAARARRLDPEAEIHLVEAGSMITHAPCGIPYYVMGVVRSVEDLVTYTPERFSKERRIYVHTRTRAVEVDPNRKIVKAVKNGEIVEFKYDKLIIATGAEPIVPRGFDVRSPKLVVVRSPEQAEEIRMRVESASSVAIVGGSYIGLEMAEVSRALGKRVVLFEAMEQLLPSVLDRDMAELVRGEAEARGVEVHLGERVVEVGSDGALITEAGRYEVDVVVLSVGVRPRAELAVSAGVELGRTGAVKTNEYMETNVPDVYAAGDVAEVKHKLTDEPTWFPNAVVANKTGAVAGANSVKGKVLRFPGTLKTAVLKFFDMYIGRTGLLEEEARGYGFNPESTRIRARVRAHYYPNNPEVHLKLIADRSSGRLLGLQAIGYDPIVAGYVDLASLMIERGYTVEEAYFVEHSYNPSVSPVWHPLIVAARTLSKGLL